MYYENFILSPRIKFFLPCYDEFFRRTVKSVQFLCFLKKHFVEKTQFNVSEYLMRKNKINKADFFLSTVVCCVSLRSSQIKRRLWQSLFQTAIQFIFDTSVMHIRERKKHVVFFSSTSKSRDTHFGSRQVHIA